MRPIKSVGPLDIATLEAAIGALVSAASLTDPSWRRLARQLRKLADEVDEPKTRRKSKKP